MSVARALLMRIFHGGAAGGAAPDPKTGKRRVSRIDAAKLCVQALLKRRLIAQVYAPLGEAGRVAIPLAMPSPPHARLGWIEVALNGDVTLHQDESSLAAQASPLITAIVVGVCASIIIQPVPADTRTWDVRGYRIVQAANGLWNVVGGNGVVHDALDTPEAATLAAERAAWDRAGAAAAAVVAIEMEREHAARWIASYLRDHDYPSRVEGTVVFVQHGDQERRVDITVRGPVFERDFPEVARTAIEGGLSSVQLVERL